MRIGVILAVIVKEHLLRVAFSTTPTIRTEVCVIVRIWGGVN